MEGDGKMACSIFVDSAEVTWVNSKIVKQIYPDHHLDQMSY